MKHRLKQERMCELLCLLFQNTDIKAFKRSGLRQEEEPSHKTYKLRLLFFFSFLKDFFFLFFGKRYYYFLNHTNHEFKITLGYYIK